jgi:hypothetical protein
VYDVHISSHHGINSVATFAVSISPVFSPFLTYGWWWREDRWVVKVSFSAHHTICACYFQTLRNVLVLQNVSIRENDGVFWQALPEKSNHLPVRQTRVVTFLFSPPAVYGDDACACVQDSLRIFQRLLLRFQHPHLRRDRYIQLLVQLVYHSCDQTWIFLQECTVLAPLCYALRTSQVQIYRIAEWRNVLRSSQQVVRIVRAELHCKRSVEGRVSIKMPFRIRELRSMVCVRRG